MTHRRLAPAFLAAALTALLAACSTAPAPAALNGTYVGDVDDASVGYLGSHAMEVTTSGTSFTGTYCLVAVNGDAACNTVNGSVTGTSESGSVDFTVGTVAFWGDVTGNREIRGDYAHAEGTGTFDMRLDTTASATNLEPQGEGPAAPETHRLLDAVGGR